MCGRSNIQSFENRAIKYYLCNFKPTCFCVVICDVGENLRWAWWAWWFGKVRVSTNGECNRRLWSSWWCCLIWLISALNLILLNLCVWTSHKVDYTLIQWLNSVINVYDLPETMLHTIMTKSKTSLVYISSLINPAGHVSVAKMNINMKNWIRI